MHSDPLTNNDRPSADQPVTPGADLPSAAPPAPEGPRRSSARDAVVLSVIVIVIAVMIWSAVRVSQRRGPQPAVTPGATLIGKTAPNFQLTTLDGKQVSLTDFRGKAVLLNFWATWCGPCRIEMPWFVDLQKKYAPQGFEIVGVAMDDSGEKAIKEFTQQVGTNYTILLGKDAIGDAYGVEGMPTSFFIARDGKIIDQTLGLASKKELEDRIERALASGPQSSMAGAPASPWAAVVSSAAAQKKQALRNGLRWVQPK